MAPRIPNPFDNGDDTGFVLDAEAFMAAICTQPAHETGASSEFENLLGALADRLTSSRRARPVRRRAGSSQQRRQSEPLVAFDRKSLSM